MNLECPHGEQQDEVKEKHKIYKIPYTGYRYPTLAIFFNVIGILGLILGFISLSVFLRDRYGTGVFLITGAALIFWSFVWFGFAYVLDKASQAAYNSQKILQILKYN